MNIIVWEGTHNKAILQNLLFWEFISLLSDLFHSIHWVSKLPAIFGGRHFLRIYLIDYFKILDEQKNIFTGKRTCFIVIKIWWCLSGSSTHIHYSDAFIEKATLLLSSLLQCRNFIFMLLTYFGECAWLNWVDKTRENSNCSSW